MSLVASMRRPSGFSDPAYYEEPVTVLGYSYGKHQDAGGYDLLGEVTLAIVQRSSGPLCAVPLHWIFAPDLSKGGEE